MKNHPLKSHPRTVATLFSAVLICGLFALPSISSESSMEAVSSEFAPPSTGTMALKSMLKECYSPVLAEPAKRMLVNGSALNAAQAKNIQWFGRCVFPFLPGKTREEQALYAARTSWWALREGNLDLTGEKVFRYSNCNIGKRKRPGSKEIRWTGDKHRSDQPLFTCPKTDILVPMWQVGIAGGQVTNWGPEEYDAMVDKVSNALSPTVQEKDLLAWSATLAGFKDGTAEHRGIVNSKDRLKRSWLLRNPLIGTMFVQDLEVRRECFLDGMKKEKYQGCFGGKYAAAVKFGNGPKSMRRSVSDLQRIYLNGSFD